MTENNKSAYPRVREILACRLVDDEYVLIFEEDGRDLSVVLNPAASRAFGLMSGTRSIAEICEVLTAEGVGKAEAVRAAVEKLAAELQRRGVLALSEEPWKSAGPVRLQQAAPLNERSGAAENMELPMVTAPEPTAVVAGTCDALWDGGGNCQTGICITPFSG